MNKDEIQQTKALIKLKCIKRIIDILQDLNLLENQTDMKQYNIILDYDKELKQDFTTFKVKVESESLNRNYTKMDKTLFDFKFKLKDETTGFAIFQSIREYFVKKNDLQYPAFQRNLNFRDNCDDEDNVKYIHHKIKTNHNLDLYSIIHSKVDEQKLEKFDKRICENYKSFIKKIHTVDFNKDQRQILKANKKSEIACAVIDMLNELSNSDYAMGRSYEILIDYHKYSTYYEFRIKILKNSKSIPLCIKFKLKNEKDGIKILDNIVNYYIENYDIMFDSYNNKVDCYDKKDYIIIGKNNVNLNYKISAEYFDEAISTFKQTMEIKQKQKKLEKTK